MYTLDLCTSLNVSVLQSEKKLNVSLVEKEKWKEEGAGGKEERKEGEKEKNKKTMERKKEHIILVHFGDFPSNCSNPYHPIAETFPSDTPRSAIHPHYFWKSICHMIPSSGHFLNTQPLSLTKVIDITG